jgi:hypothetical protein
MSKPTTTKKTTTTKSTTTKPTDNGKPVAELTDSRLETIAMFGSVYGVSPKLIAAVMTERKRRGIEW